MTNADAPRAPASERRPAVERLLGAGIASGLALAGVLATAFALTMGLSADEAWLLLSVQGLLEDGVWGHRHGPGALTTGGVHTLAHVLVGSLGGPSLSAHRLVTVLAFALLLLEVFAWGRRAGLSRPASLLLVSPLLAVPGTTTLAGTAFGAVPATLLLVWGVRAWDPSGERGLPADVASGLLLGLAAATRVQVVLILPALWIAALARGRLDAAGWRSLLVPTATAVATLGAAVLALHALTPADGWAVARVSLGLGAQQNVVFWLKKWLVAEQALALPALVAALLVGAWVRGRWPEQGQRLSALAWFATLGWIVWVVASPLELLWYLWPSLGAAAIVLGYGLAALHELGGDRAWAGARRAALALGLACVASGVVTGSRNLLIGDLNLITSEWSERIGTGPQRRRDAWQWGFPYANGQWEMARFLRELPPERAIAAMDSALELEYLSQRPLLPLHWFHAGRDVELRLGCRDCSTEALRWSGRPPPDTVLLTPHLGSRVHLSPRGRVWVERQCQLEARFGEHRLCRFSRFPANLGALLPSEQTGP